MFGTKAKRISALLAVTVVGVLLSPGPADASSRAFSPRTAVFEIVARHSNKCVDVHNAYTHNGANVHQWSCVNVPQQRWYIQGGSQGYFEIRASHSGKCLDVHNAYTHDGANIHQWECVNVPQQHWKFVYSGVGEYWQMKARHSGKCLDVHNGYTHNGANVHQWSCVNVPQQQFLIRWIY